MVQKFVFTVFTTLHIVQMAISMPNIVIKYNYNSVQQIANVFESIYAFFLNQIELF